MASHSSRGVQVIALSSLMLLAATGSALAGNRGGGVSFSVVAGGVGRIWAPTGRWGAPRHREARVAVYVQSPRRRCGDAQRWRGYRRYYRRDVYRHARSRYDFGWDGYRRGGRTGRHGRCW